MSRRDRGALAALAELERIKAEFLPPRAARKAELLERLRRARLARPAHVLRLHEAACFLAAYPDDAAVLARVERLLGEFAGRADLRAARGALADSGVAGTEIRYPFFAGTARWLARRHGDCLAIDWNETRANAVGGHAFGGAAREAELDETLERLLSLIAHHGETPGLDEIDLGLRGWLARMAGRGTDAALLALGVDALDASDEVKEYLYERLGLWLRLSPGTGRDGRPTPSRTRARFRGAPIVFQTRPLRRERPDLGRALRERPLSVRSLPPPEAQQLLDLAREAMIVRSRDLDVFASGDVSDVRLIDWGGGLSFACIGFLPARRLLLESVYGLLTLQNGVPVGYVLLSALCGSSEVAYNVFETWRGGEGAYVYGRVLATARHLFGSDSFTIYPYQLGDDNDEALQSGAWWFYQKLGFRSKDRGVLALMRRELAAMRRRPSHRSSIATLRRLARQNVYYHMERPRDDVIGVLDLAEIGLAVTDLLARRFGPDRAAASRACLREARVLLGLGGLAAGAALRRWTPGERQALQRWAPLVLLLGVERWPAAARRALLPVIRTKGGVRESDFVALFDRHRRLRSAVARLATPR